MSKKNVVSGLALTLICLSTAFVQAGLFTSPCDEACGDCIDTIACDPCDAAVCNPCDSIFDGCQPRRKSLMDSIKVYGWLQAGITVNNHGHKNTYNGGSPASRNLDPLAGNSYIFGVAQPSDLKINQLWLGLTKAKDTRHGWDWGFQTDFMFGTDAKYVQSFGDQTFDYGWGSGDYYDSIVQLYAEIGYKDLTLRAGKFSTIMCHEALPGPMSFFYSHAYFCYTGPLTHQGAVAEYKINDRWTVLGGWTAGYHNSLENPLGDNAFLGQLRYTIDKNRALTYTLYNGWHNGYNKHANALTKYRRNYERELETIMTLRYTWQLNCKWFYMIESIWNQGNMKEVRDINGDSVGDIVKKAYGFNQHLIYTINKKWSVGTRFEWLSSQGTFCDIAPITGSDARGAALGSDLYALTFCTNWNPRPNINIRPELRYDWSFYKSGFQPFGGGNKSEQLTGGLSASVSF